MGVRLGGLATPKRKGVTPARRGFDLLAPRRRPPLGPVADAVTRGEGRDYLEALGRVVRRVGAAR